MQKPSASGDSAVIVYARSHVDSREASPRSSTGWRGHHARHPGADTPPAADHPVHARLVGGRRAGRLGCGDDPVRRPARQGRQHHADRGAADDQFACCCWPSRSNSRSASRCCRSDCAPRPRPTHCWPDESAIWSKTRDRRRRRHPGVRRGGLHRRGGHRGARLRLRLRRRRRRQHRSHGRRSPNRQGQR